MYTTIILLLVICVIVFKVSRKNYQNRTSNLSLNHDEYKSLIRKKYYNLSESDRKKFINSLSKDLYTYFNIEIIKNKDSKFKNTWSIQQKMIKQNEIMKHLSKF